MEGAIMSAHPNQPSWRPARRPRHSAWRVRSWSTNVLGLTQSPTIIVCSDRVIEWGSGTHRASPQARRTPNAHSAAETGWVPSAKWWGKFARPEVTLRVNVIVGLRRRAPDVRPPKGRARAGSFQASPRAVLTLPYRRADVSGWSGSRLMLGNHFLLWRRQGRAVKILR